MKRSLLSSAPNKGSKFEESNEPKSNKSETQETQANVLTGAVGWSYATRMVMLLFIRGIFKNLPNFRLETEVDNVGKFDDIVFDEGGQKYWLLQLKHRTYQKQLHSHEILEVDDKYDLKKAFNLLTYIYSYVQAKAQQKFNKKGVIKRAVLITNVPELDLNEDNEMCLFTDDGQKRVEIQLSEVIFGQNNLLFFRQRSVKYYKFNDPTLVPILYAQATKYESEVEQLGDLTPENIKEGLDAITYAVGQPTDAELETIIKCEIQSHFKITFSTAEILFNDLQDKVLNWLKTKNRECDPKQFPRVLTFDVAQGFFQSRLKKVSFGIECPVKTFFGRTRELKVIKDQLMHRSRLCVTGIRGCGKPVLVRKFIEVYGRDEYFDRIIWIDATNDTTIEISFKCLAEQLCLKTDGIPTSILIEYFLCEYFYNLKTLFVFNDFQLNGDLHRQIMECMTKTTSKQCSFCPGLDFILIVHDPVPDLGMACVKIGPLEKPQAMNMLMSGLNDVILDESDKKSLEMIAGMVECYPLGLCLAMNFLRMEHKRLKYFQNCFKIDAYLQEFISIQKRTEQKYTKCLENCNSLEKSVFVLLSLVLTRVQEEPNGSKAITMLKVLAFIHPNDINANIFLPLFCPLSGKDQRLQMNEVSSTIELLKRYCLVRVDCNRLLIHPLAQKILRLKFLADLDRFGQKQLLVNILKVVLWNETCLRMNFSETCLQDVVNKLDRNKLCASSQQKLHLSALYPCFCKHPDLISTYGGLFDEYRQKLLLQAANKDDLKLVARLLSSKATTTRMLESTLERLVKERCDKTLTFLMEQGLIDIQTNPCLAESLLYLVKKYKDDEMENYLKKKGIRVEKFNEEEVQKLSSNIIKCLICCV